MMRTDDQSLKSVASHYAHGDLESTILAALEMAGKNPDQLKPEELAAIDEFHIGGRNATIELARVASPERGMQVLDLGSGLGGASRYLAQEFGCRVIGLDLSEEYCRVANDLARRLNLADQVSYWQGNAVELPFSDCSFDLVWTQHAAMNIPDKSRFYREIWRVLKPGGRLALYDILTGEGGEVYFPVPWAREPETNFLITPSRLAELLKETGFTTAHWRDATQDGLDWFRRRQEKMAVSAPPILGLHLLLGPEFKQMARNQLLNLEQDRTALIEAVVRKSV